MTDVYDYYFLGIGGTLTGNVALLTLAQGSHIGGWDKAIYPPMSSNLSQALGANFQFSQGDCPEQLPEAKLYVVGNAVSRGNQLLETILKRRLPMTSPVELLRKIIPPQRPVIAVAGTHGKTTTSSMVKHILVDQGLNPGWLIGGVMQDGSPSSHWGSDASPFVVEADEYDTAFYDKRAKLVHYQPDQLLINNLEFDHGDIYDDLPAIQKQFHQAIRALPADAKVVINADEIAIEQTMQMGCWSKVVTFSGTKGKLADFYLDAQGTIHSKKGSQSAGPYHLPENIQGINQSNAMAAVILAHGAGVSLEDSVKSLGSLALVKRRMQVVQEQPYLVIDDFAHHPTAIRAVIELAKVQTQPKAKLVIALDLASNTMKSGLHTKALLQLASEHSDIIWWVWGPKEPREALKTMDEGCAYHDKTSWSEALRSSLENKDSLLMLSNGAFEGLREQFVTS